MTDTVDTHDDAIWQIPWWARVVDVELLDEP